MRTEPPPIATAKSVKSTGLGNMPREINYRFWTGRVYVPVGSITFFTDGTLHINDEWPHPNAHNGSVLEQFTGLLDRNGKEIYEGDILKCSTIHPDDHETPGLEEFNTPVRFSERSGFITWHYGFPVWSWAQTPANPSCWCEIIGNIHESPHLLNNPT